jgi:hypothetical protein
VTRDLAVARACRLLAALELAGAAWLAHGGDWLYALLAAVFIPSLILVDVLCRRAYRDQRATDSHQPAHDTRSSR